MIYSIQKQYKWKLLFLKVKFLTRDIVPMNQLKDSWKYCMFGWAVFLGTEHQSLQDFGIKELPRSSATNPSEWGVCPVFQQVYGRSKNQDLCEQD